MLLVLALVLVLVLVMDVWHWPGHNLQEQTILGIVAKSHGWQCLGMLGVKRTGVVQQAESCARQQLGFWLLGMPLASLWEC